MTSDVLYIHIKIFKEGIIAKCLQERRLMNRRDLMTHMARAVAPRNNFAIFCNEVIITPFLNLHFGGDAMVDISPIFRRRLKNTLQENRALVTRLCSNFARGLVREGVPKVTLCPQNRARTSTGNSILY